MPEQRVETMPEQVKMHWIEWWAVAAKPLDQDHYLIFGIYKTEEEALAASLEFPQSWGAQHSHFGTRVPPSVGWLNTES